MKFLVVGAGIGGLTAAHALLRQGHEVAVFEAAPELREVGAGLVLGANVVQGLGRLGLADEVATLGAPLAGLTILDETGRTLLDVDAGPYVRAHFAPFGNVALRHAALQGALLRRLPPGVVRTGKVFTGFEATAAGVTARFADGSRAAADALLGADGLHSRVRAQVLPQALPRYAGYTCWRAVVEAADLRLPTGRFRETWGRAGRFGYVPVGGGGVYWFACVNSPRAHDPHFGRFGPDELQRHFAAYHAPTRALVARTAPAQLLWHDIVDLPPLPRFAFGRVLLLGDAAHATTPNLGQGAGQAIEDALALAECLAAPDDPATAFRRFEQRRRARTRRIQQRSWRVGRVAQWPAGALASARDWALQHAPRWLAGLQTRFIYDARF